MASVKKLFSLDENVTKELAIVAKALNKSQKEIVESALDFYFDYTDTIISDSILKNIRDNKMKVYDSKDVYKELGIDIED